MEGGALFPVFAESAHGQVIFFPSRARLALRRFGEFRHLGTHLGKLLCEGPVPACLCDDFLQTLARRANQGKLPLAGVDADQAAADVPIGASD